MEQAGINGLLTGTGLPLYIWRDLDKNTRTVSPWIPEKALIISSYDREKLNPLNKIQIRDGLHIYAITLNDSKMYFTDWGSNSVRRIEESGADEIALAEGLNRPTQSELQKRKLNVG